MYLFLIIKIHIYTITFKIIVSTKDEYMIMIATSLCYENGQKSKGEIEDIHDAQIGIIVCINKQPGLEDLYTL